MSGGEGGELVVEEGAETGKRKKGSVEVQGGKSCLLTVHCW